MKDVNVEELEPRSLQVMDLFKVASIIGKCFDKLLKASEASGIGLKEFEKKVKKIKAKKGKKFKELEEKELKEQDKDFEIFGMKLFNIIYEVAKDDIEPFMAGLVNMKVEEFEVLSYKAPIVIIEKLADKEDLPDFFQRAIKLIEMFRPSGKKRTS